MRLLLWGSLVGSCLVLSAGQAEARRRGIIATECSGCHGNAVAVVEITASPAAIAPGDDVTFTVTVRRMAGTAGVGGISVSQPPIGALHALSGEGLTLVEGSGLTHSQPKTATNGVATFRFGWRAPAEPTGIIFDVAAVAGDGDGRSMGDAAGFARFRAAVGCEPAIHYADLDRDGYGTEAFETSIGCAGVTPPLSFAVLAGDCNDNDPAIFPDALEKCNRKDDDCDGEIDENAELVELFPDADGDGHYQTRSGTPVIGCSGMTGYAAEPGDCAPEDPLVHAGATEVCNLKDDNCDGRADERVRPQCGVGRCRRESYDCDPAHCMPGEPTLERCNLLDDDCNDEVDEGDDLCEPGSACLAGKCVVSDGAGGGAGGPAMSTGGAAAVGGAGSGTSGAPGAGGTSGTAATGSGGSAAPGTGGSAAGSSGSGTSSGSGAAQTGGDPVTSDAPSGCSFGARGAMSERFGVALLALAGAWLVRRRRAR